MNDQSFPSMSKHQPLTDFTLEQLPNNTMSSVSTENDIGIVTMFYCPKCAGPTSICLEQLFY